jgi:predicted lipid-binding transport protein (Tim44 family)
MLLQLLDPASNHCCHGMTFRSLRPSYCHSDIPKILTGVLRHYATILATPPKPASTPSESRERQAIMRGINLRNNASAVLSPAAFEARKSYLVNGYKNGAFLKSGPEGRGQAAPNPMTDPAAMEGMMGMMKGNMAMMIPQTLIMGWINAFFAGFVIRKSSVGLLLAE